MTSGQSRATGNREQKLLRNRNAILTLVRKYPGLSRQDCARRLELSTFTLSRVVGKLIQDGLLREEDSRPNGTASRTGRPATPLTVNADAAFFAGIDLEASCWRFVVVDFAGTERFRLMKAISKRKTPQRYHGDLQAFFEEARSACGALWESVAGLGIAAPGLLNVEEGVIEVYHPLPGFEKIEILNLYREIFGRPTFLLHNVVSLAACDLWLRPGSEDEVTFHAVVRSGIAGVLTDRRRVFRGSHGLAGELGDWSVDLGSGASGCLQDIAGLQALRHALADAERDLWAGVPEAVDRALRKPRSERCLKRAMHALGFALAGVAALLDPDRIVVYSPLLSESNALWPLLHEAFLSRINPAFSGRMVFARSEQTETAAAVGAALFALNNAYPATAAPLRFPG